MKSEKDITIMRVKVPTKLKVRAAPSFDGRVVALLANKGIVEVSEKITNPDGTWCKVETYIPPISRSRAHYKLEFGDADSPLPFKNPVWVNAKYLKRTVRFPKLFEKR